MIFTLSKLKEVQSYESRATSVDLPLIYSENSQNNAISTIPSTLNFPPRRVGAAATTLHGKTYLFSGRGGIAMIPIEEHGSLWAFDPTTANWDLQTPTSSIQPYPEARSYHSLTNDGRDTVYLHGGCPESGRLSDLWSFHIPSKSWTRLMSAPGPPRGGTSIAFSGGLLYRMNGFDGKTEQGGTLDIYSPDTNTWVTHVYHADGQSGPGPRSVSALISLTVNGRLSLLTLFGERDPSPLGHHGAGKMLDDVWIFDVESRVWSEVQAGGYLTEPFIGEELKPAPRGWFAAEAIGGCIAVQGGLGESNERLGDVWLLKF